MSTEPTERKVIAHVTVSMDGFIASAGDDGADGMAWLLDYATSEQSETYFEGIWRGCDTVLLGRTNYEGFYSVWPAMATDPSLSARTREVGTWFDAVEKVVFSRTLSGAEWQHARVAERELTDEVRALKRAEGRDIIVLSSASIIRQLHAANLVDEFRLNVLPAILGDGKRLFADDHASLWRLVTATTMDTGAIGMQYAHR